MEECIKAEGVMQELSSPVSVLLSIPCRLVSRICPLTFPLFLIHIYLGFAFKSLRYYHSQQLEEGGVTSEQTLG